MDGSSRTPVCACASEIVELRHQRKQFSLIRSLVVARHVLRCLLAKESDEICNQKGIHSHR
jgi:hypothetical protein